MKEKMAKKLEELYSNLGLGKELLNSVACMAIVGLPEDADDAAIEARAKESSVEGMLKSFQSHADKIRTQSQKVTPEPKKNEGGDNANEGNAALEEVKSLLKQMSDANAKLAADVAALSAKNKQADFDSLVSRIGKEMDLSGSVLDLCKAGLSSDMTETEIRDALGAKKKTLLDGGWHFSERSSDVSATQEDAERKEAAAWAEEKAKQYL